MPSTSTLDQVQNRLLEAFDELYADFVDPRGAYCDNYGAPWQQLGTPADLNASTGAPFSSEQQLTEIRNQCRALATSNEYAINGHENRISYIVGTGHTYRATPRKGMAPPDDLVRRTQDYLDQFLLQNDWRARQEEIVLRRDRDGEVFLRFFIDPDATTQVRFVEPAQVATPTHLLTLPHASFGIQTDPHDVESPQFYFIDGQPVPATEIQHRRTNVDRNVKRGLPLFYPVRKNLRRAEKLLRNMSVLAEIQSAIALIRKHRGTTASGVRQFAASTADATATSPASGQTGYLRHYAPGTILDSHAGIEYDFPASGLDASNYVAVLRAELRAIAARLVMPEFMLTSDASNANYSSTLIAEGPAVKMFARLQAQQTGDDRRVLRRILQTHIDAGHLPDDTFAQVEIQIVPPTIAVRDQLQQARTRRIQHAAGILSPQTWSQQIGLDYDQEQTNIAQHTPNPTIV